MLISGPTVLESDIMSYMKKPHFWKPSAEWSTTLPLFSCARWLRGIVFSWVGLEGNIWRVGFGWCLLPKKFVPCMVPDVGINIVTWQLTLNTQTLFQPRLNKLHAARAGRPLSGFAARCVVMERGGTWEVKGNQKNNVIKTSKKKRLKNIRRAGYQRRTREERRERSFWEAGRVRHHLHLFSRGFAWTSI